MNCEYKPESFSIVKPPNVQQGGIEQLKELTIQTEREKIKLSAGAIINPSNPNEVGFFGIDERRIIHYGTFEIDKKEGEVATDITLLDGQIVTTGFLMLNTGEFCPEIGWVYHWHGEIDDWDSLEVARIIRGKGNLWEFEYENRGAIVLMTTTFNYTGHEDEIHVVYWAN